MCHNLFSNNSHWFNQCSQGIKEKPFGNAYDLLDLELIHIFVYSLFIYLIHSFSMLVYYFH